jgi:hypothetical protein
MKLMPLGMSRTLEIDMRGRSWRGFIVLRRHQDALITLFCVAVLLCGLAAWAFDLAGAWEVFGIGAMIAGAIVLASAVLG